MCAYACVYICICVREVCIYLLVLMSVCMCIRMYFCACVCFTFGVLMCACICLCAPVIVNAILYVCVFSFHKYATVSYLSVENNAVDFSVKLNSG